MCTMNKEIIKVKCNSNIEVAEGNTEIAQHRLEDMACLSVAAIAALTHLPVTTITADAAKRKVAT